MFDDRSDDVDAAAGVHDAPAAGGREGAGADSEAEVLRDELTRQSRMLEELRAEAQASQDRYLRSRADFDNFRRRMDSELVREREAGMDSMMLPVLGVFDDLERAISAAEAAGETGAFITGIRAVRDSLVRQLDTLGVRLVGKRGEDFDPELHEALAVVPPPRDLSDGAIVEVYSAGFAKGDRLVRPAKVVVAKSGA